MDAKADLTEAIEWLESRLAKAERPVVLAGQGIDLSGTKKEFYDFKCYCNNILHMFGMGNLRYVSNKIDTNPTS